MSIGTRSEDGAHLQLVVAEVHVCEAGEGADVHLIDRDKAILGAVEQLEAVKLRELGRQHFNLVTPLARKRRA